MTTSSPKSTAPALRVGDWRVDTGSNELSRGNKAVRLEPKAIEVLVYLARQPGRVVARDELLTAVWPGVVVGDDALTQAVNKLRKALGDDAHVPTYIETISKRGYRLIAPVTQIAPSHTPARAWAPRRIAFTLMLGTAVLVAAGALLVFFASEKPVSPPIVAGGKAGAAVIALPAVAVLPFSNLSGDPKRDYVSDAFTEDVINALGRFSGLRVMSRNSVEPFRHRAPTPQAISELGARYIVKGSLREADGKLRVAVELSDAGNGTQLWAERYDGEGRDVVQIQDRIARDIVGKLEVKLTRLEQDRAAAKPPESLEAYDLVLRARALLVTTERTANRQARALLAKAIELAPNYADPYVELARAESLRANFGWIEDPAEGLLRAEQLLRRALAIDAPGVHARAHGQLGMIYASQGKFDQALAEADRALALNPSDAAVYDVRGGTLMYLGRLEEAIASIETGMRFNPAGRSSASGFNLALAYYSLERYREALAAADATLMRYPKEPFVHAIRAATLAQMGSSEAANKAVADLHRVNPFFQTEQFGDRFVHPENKARLQEGLRKAGL